MESICKSIETKGWGDIENECYCLLTAFLYASPNKYESPRLLNRELNYLKQCQDLFWHFQYYRTKTCPMSSAKIRNDSHSYNLMQP